MPKALVKCPYCNEYFDRLSEPFVKIGRRYAHETCYQKQNPDTIKQDIAKEDFYAYIKEKYGNDYPYVAISKQAESYIKQYGFTYSGMLKTLKWFYEIQGGKKENARGIGIIPYIYENAKQHYYKLYLAQERNKEINNYRLETKEIVIASPRMYIAPPKLFDLGDEE